MASFKAHFDGTAIVLDEPATLAVGQEVRVVLREQTQSADPAEVKDLSPDGFTPFASMNATFMNADEWDEGAALHVDSFEAVPDDFVRHPGTAAGQMKIADDFDETLEEFKDYL